MFRDVRALLVWVVMLLGWVPVALGQDVEAPEQESRPEVQPAATAAEVYTAAGFVFHGEMEGFVPRGRPGVREGGLVVPGDYFGLKAGLEELDAAIWWLGEERLDILESPEAGAGAGQPWSGVGDMTTSGWAIARTFENGRGSNHLGAAYLLGPEGEVIPVDAPFYNQIAPCDVNEAGVVVGWYSPNRQWRGFMWSRETGLIDLGEDGTDTVQAIAINNHGMMAGYCNRDEGDFRRVWFAPDDVIDLWFPEGFDGGSAFDINDDSVVLVNLFRCVRHARGTLHVYSPFLWNVEEGYSALPRPDGGSVFAYQMSASGDVLMTQRTRPAPGDRLDQVTTLYVCTSDGDLIAIPDYPGATETECRYISESGHIVGHAVFVDGEEQRYVGFVISFDGDAE
ncbi:MAG: hypothetical protein ACIAXF_05040 [Phycisphaerales bacterium JB063]